MSEYTQRYQGASHQELYDAVMAGKPGQIDGVAAQWSALKGIVDALGRDLSGDLEKLAHTWTGSAGQEFQRRLTLIVDYAGTLGEGMADVKQALTMMSGQLRTAQKQAESPEETDDHDQAVSGALKGAAVFGVPGAVVGGLLGHQQDKEEQQKAHQRMVNVVAELAAGYDLSAYGRVVTPPPPDPDTPGTVDGSGPTTRSGPHVGTPTAAPHSTGLGPHTGGETIRTPGGVGTGPTSGHGGDGSGTTGTDGSVTVTTPGVTGTGGGTSLAGADPLTGGAVPAGTGPNALGIGGTAGAGTSGGGLFPGTAGIAATGGLIATGALASSAGGSPTPPPRSPGGTAPADNRAASGVGRSVDGRRGEANRAATAGRGRGPVGNRPGVLGGRGQHDEDESDERLTWLTEDEMVWGDGRDGAPPVLGTTD
ncbi:WXG100 family type VII secretion target [Micromonospora costi]|uniref:WXG100 family type VII secretion target n=1 Tax=Micromonospora costi TaxID=1530042 RepID=A0A3B0AE68_9ACTN|nr:WXG100 family type VII secretion target [Micromonospora costi]RKN58633.1 WXG100 family type VII secretion target [Micromonospora costi]